jgi:hypothetical protein
MANEVEGEGVAQLPAAVKPDEAAPGPEVVMNTMRGRIEGLEAHRRRAPRFAGALPVRPPQALAKWEKRGSTSYPDEPIVRVYPEDPAIAPIHRPLKGFTRLVAAVAILFVARATLPLIPRTWNKA